MTTTITVTPRDGGWQAPDNSVFLIHIHIDSGDGLGHNDISLDYGDGREPVTVNVPFGGVNDYDGGFGVGFSSPDPAPGVTYAVSISGGELPNDASQDFELPSYPPPTPTENPEYRQSIGRADAAAVIPEDGPRKLGFRG